MILCVSSIAWDSDGSALRVGLTDGWYDVPVTVGAALRQRIRAGQIKVGFKLCIQEAQWVDKGQTGIAPLECACNMLGEVDAPSPKLRIAENSCRLARWDAKLGFQSFQTFPMRLSTLLLTGGRVGMIDVVILRVFPMQYMERRPDGDAMFRGEIEESREVERLQRDRISHINQLEATHRTKLSEPIKFGVLMDYIPNNRIRNRIAASVAKVGRVDPQLLSSSQNAVVNMARREAEQHREEELARERECLSNEMPHRDVIPVVRMLVADAAHRDAAVSVLTVWRSRREQFSEGSRMRVKGLGPSAARTVLRTHNSQTASPIHLSVNGRQRPQISRCSKRTLVGAGYQPRRRSFVSELPRMERGVLADVVGVLIVGQAKENEGSAAIESASSRVVYLFDESGMMLAVLMPQFESGLAQYLQGHGLRDGSVASIHNIVVDRYDSRHDIVRCRWVSDYTGIGGEAYEKAQVPHYRAAVRRLKDWSVSLEGRCVQNQLRRVVSCLADGVKLPRFGSVENSELWQVTHLRSHQDEAATGRIMLRLSNGMSAREHQMPGDSPLAQLLAPDQNALASGSVQWTRADGAMGQLRVQLAAAAASSGTGSEAHIRVIALHRILQAKLVSS